MGVGVFCRCVLRCGWVDVLCGMCADVVGMDMGMSVSCVWGGGGGVWMCVVLLCERGVVGVNLYWLFGCATYEYICGRCDVCVYSGCGSVCISWMWVWVYVVDVGVGRRVE